MFDYGRSFAILLVLYGVGELAVWLSGLPIPGSIVGMVLLAVCLSTNVFRMEHVEKSADLLLSQLSLLFVPPAVAIMLYLDLLMADLLALLIGTVGSLLAVLWLTGFCAQRLIRQRSDRSDGR